MEFDSIRRAVNVLEKLLELSKSVKELTADEYTLVVRSLEKTLSQLEGSTERPIRKVKHGKWIEDDYGYYRCSECSYEHDSPEYITPYCPNCGAKMDLEWLE